MTHEETLIQNDIVTYLRKRHVIAIRINASGLDSGIPDLISEYRGRFVAIEVKIDDGKELESQEAFINQVISDGGFGAFVRSVDDVKALLKKIDKEIIWER